MKLKFILSTCTLLLFALIAGGSFDGDDFLAIFYAILVVTGIYVIWASITDMVKNKNKTKRIEMIKEDEANSTDFDRSVFIGDDRCKIYFDSTKKKVMIMRIMTKGINKEYVDDFEFPGKSLATYCSPVFIIYDPKRRKLLSGTYDDINIKYAVTDISSKDKNIDVQIKNGIAPIFRTLNTTTVSADGTISSTQFSILLDEGRGLIAITCTGKVKYVFNYISASNLPRKTGDKSSVKTLVIGNYMFIMDEFFKVLVIITRYGGYKLINYSDIIEVSYEENGTSIYTKSAGRTVGGAIVGGVLMGGAGAVVGGLSGVSRENKEVKNMDVKILLRNTSQTSHVLHFKVIERVLKTKEVQDMKMYENYLKNAIKAKDILSVIIDKANQETTTVRQINLTPTNQLSVADELSKLAKLKESGILSEEEFNAQKAKLLNL